MSSIFKVCYTPDFSEEFIHNIKTWVTPSMISSEEDSFQYQMDSINNMLHDNDIELSIKDQFEFDSLVDQGVKYVEF